MLWSTQRRIIYGGGVLLALALIVGSIFYYFFYKAPTCFDGSKNGDESGVDCGGSCTIICTSDTLTPIVLWAKAFNVSGDSYNLMAYAENPNANSVNEKADYEFKVFDDQNVLLTVRQGSTSIPRNRMFGIFEPGLTFKNKKPKRVEFSFISFGKWKKDIEPAPNLTLSYSSLLATSTAPRIEGTITNNSLASIPKIELTAFVIDGKENVVAASRTFVDGIAEASSEQFVFYWPKPFNLGVEVCARPLDIAVAIDVSGSMRSDSLNPPEPFTTVKTTARDFVANLPDEDRVSVITFGTDAKVISPLSADKQKVGQDIEALALSTTSENTNIGQGLSTAMANLASSTVKRNGKAIVLLTDGIPTEPVRKDIAGYPRLFAEETANSVAMSGTVVYTIGLGKNINSGLLETIAGASDRMYLAPTKETLAGIYKQIGSALCPKKPNAITVLYRLVQD